MIIKLETGDDSYKGKGETVISALKDARVASIKKTDDGMFSIQEQCDGYFYAKLSKEQMLALIDELTMLATP